MTLALYCFHSVNLEMLYCDIISHVALAINIYNIGPASWLNCMGRGRFEAFKGPDFK